ncbi:MAG: YaaR family protein [Christensenellales bacterium]|jgi:uncharacterized protein YaaR (DUF327 family)
MRIKDVNKIPRDTSRLAPTEEKKSSSGFNQSFHRQLSEVNAAEYEEHIKDLTQRIYQQGEIVSKRVDLAEYQKYRELITELLNETASNSYLFCKMNKFDARGRHKIFAVIRKVNSKLDELAAAILEEEADNIRTLEIVDDIRGLLVDMFM